MPTALGVGALTLYVVGVISTVGQIRATNLEVGRSMALIPLEEHLRNGVGVVVDPFFLFLVVVFALFYLITRSSSASTSQPRSDSTGERVWLIVSGLVILLVIVATPWPIIIVFVILLASWVALALLRTRVGGFWKTRRAEAYVLVNVAAALLVAALDTYFRSDPFPRASVVTEDRRLSGPLIAVNNGLVYLGPSEDEKLYVSVAADRVVAMETEPQKREEEPSLLNLVGIDWPRKRD